MREAKKTPYFGVIGKQMSPDSEPIIMEQRL
jgi:hypothetical protein